MGKNTYILVQWPESQDYMEEEWFNEEAILALGSEETTGSSTYFIPEERLINNEYILQKSEELALKFKSTPEEDSRIDKNWNEALPFEDGMNTFESVLNLKLSLKK
jgi:hypothetical protein